MKHSMMPLALAFWVTKESVVSATKVDSAAAKPSLNDALSSLDACAENLTASWDQDQSSARADNVSDEVDTSSHSPSYPQPVSPSLDVPPVAHASLFPSVLLTY